MSCWLAFILARAFRVFVSFVSFVFVQGIADEATAPDPELEPDEADAEQETETVDPEGCVSTCLQSRQGLGCGVVRSLTNVIYWHEQVRWLVALRPNLRREADIDMVFMSFFVLGEQVNAGMYSGREIHEFHCIRGELTYILGVSLK